MSNLTEREKNRRLFLKYLAASPVLGMGAQSALAASAGEMQGRPTDPYIWFPHDPNYAVQRAEDALDVFEMEATCAKLQPPAHFAFVASGADDDGGQTANRAGIAKVALRPYRLRNVSNVDTSVEVYGEKYSQPFFLCPVGGETIFNPDGVLAGLRASGKNNVAQMLSTYANATVAQGNQARNGNPVIYQLYHTSLAPLGNFEVTKALAQKAEREGAKTVAVTIDNPSARKHTQLMRARRSDRRVCVECHDTTDPTRLGRAGKGGRPIQMAEIPADILNQKPTDPQDWELIKRLRDVTKMNIILKGIMHPDDAATAAKLGYGVHVSNHGARNEDTSASTIGVLPDIVTAVKGRVPIFIDGGFRRGMDIVKALAIGATMVGFGRPWMWGLGAFGEAGVDRVIKIVAAETLSAMQQVGAASVKELRTMKIVSTSP